MSRFETKTPMADLKDQQSKEYKKLSDQELAGKIEFFNTEVRAEIPQSLKDKALVAAKKLVEISREDSNTADSKAREFGIVDSRLIKLIQAAPEDKKLDIALRMVDLREVGFQNNFVKGANLIDFIEKSKNELEGFKDTLSKKKEEGNTSSKSFIDLEKKIEGYERKISVQESELKGQQAGLYENIRRSGSADWVSDYATRDTGILLDALKGEGANGLALANKITEKGKYSAAVLRTVDEIHASEQGKRDAALSLNIALARNEGNKTEMVLAARDAQKNGNNDPILTNALKKYDFSRAVLPPPPTSTYKMDKEEQKAKEALFSGITPIETRELHSSLISSFNNSPRSETKTISRVPYLSTEEDQRARGGLLLLANKLKKEGDVSALKELKESVANDPKLKHLIKESDAALVFNPKTPHIDAMRVPEKHAYAVFSKSLEQLESKNVPKVEDEKFEKLAIANLQKKNYSNEYLESLAKVAKAEGNNKLSSILERAVA